MILLLTTDPVNVMCTTDVLLLHVKVYTLLWSASGEAILCFPAFSREGPRDSHIKEDIFLVPCSRAGALCLCDDMTRFPGQVICSICLVQSPGQVNRSSGHRKLAGI